MTPEQQAQTHEPAPSRLESDAAGAARIISPDDMVKLKAKRDGFAKVMQMTEPGHPDHETAKNYYSQLQRLFASQKPALDVSTPETGMDTFERNYASAATLGGSDALVKHLARTRIPGFSERAPDGDTADFVTARDRQEGDAANPAQSFAGGLTGSGALPSLVFKGAAKPFSIIRAGESAGPALRVSAGIARGVGQSVTGSAAIAGAHGALEDAPTNRERLSGAWEATKGELTSPAPYIAGGLLGAAEGTADAIRSGHGQTGRDIRTVEDVAKGSATPIGPRGGYYESPVMKGMHTDEDVGEVSRRAGDSIRGKLNTEFKAAGSEYAASKGEAAASGALARQIDPAPLLKQAQELMSSPRLTSATKAAIEREVVNPLMDVMTVPQGNGAMSLEHFNDFKSKLGDIAHVPIGADSTFQHRAFGELADTARTMRHATALGEIDQAYAQRMDRLEGAHEAMGFRDKTHTDMTDPVAARKVGNFIARHGEDTKTAGMQNEDARRIEALFPGLVTQELSAPEMLRARQRMTPGLGHSGGGFHGHVKGLISQNAEPLAVGAYQAGRLAPRAMAPANELARSIRDILFAAHEAEQQRNAERAAQMGAR